LIEGKKGKIIVAAAGGQGYIFGKGNQQTAAEVIKKIRRENTMVVAAKNKLLSLKGKPLLADTSDG